MLHYMESNGKLPQIFIASKTVTLVPEFAVEVLPLGRTAAFVPVLWAEHSDDVSDSIKIETI